MLSSKWAYFTAKSESAILQAEVLTETCSINSTGKGWEKKI